MALASLRGARITAFLFSAWVNLLLLAAPIYMLQIYDRVLVAHSVETLVVLTLLLVGLFVVQGALDHARARIMARVGARLQGVLEDRVMEAALRRLSRDPTDLPALAGERDLDALSRFWASPGRLALYDLPWTPIFFGSLFLIHSWLGILALAGAMILVLAGLANDRAGAGPLQAASQEQISADRLAGAMKAEADLLQALGMAGAARLRWRDRRAAARLAALAASDQSGRWTVAIRTFRMFLQSAMLGLAAYLVLKGELSPSVLAATSILLGRALLPIEQTVAHWSGLARAQQARERLIRLLTAAPTPTPRLDLPRPAARLVVRDLSVTPPGRSRPTLRSVSFALQPGQVLGVIGASGAGKSTLARAIAGIWHPDQGEVRLDGTSFDHYDPDRLGGWIGYLPQRITLFEGTVAENIARLRPGVASEEVIAAARAAAAHDMILRLPDGYDTRLPVGGGGLSGGQLQRIGLARALFGDPVLLVLDEPNANLDSDGAQALNLAIRAARSIGSAVVIMAHRPMALRECDFLMVLKDGAVAALGPRDETLRGMVQNGGDLARALAAAGASG